MEKTCMLIGGIVVLPGCIASLEAIDGVELVGTISGDCYLMIALDTGLKLKTANMTRKNAGDATMLIAKWMTQ